MAIPVISYDIIDKCEVTGWPRITVEHDGNLRWIHLQEIKNDVWGRETVAIEVMPPESCVVNGRSTEFHYRHIWKLPDGYKWPNMRPDGMF